MGISEPAMTETPLNVKLSMSVWATPANGQSLEHLVVAVREAGNEVLMVDGVNGRVLIARYDQTEMNGD